MPQRRRNPWNLEINEKSYIFCYIYSDSCDSGFDNRPEIIYEKTRTGKRRNAS